MWDVSPHTREQRRRARVSQPAVDPSIDDVVADNLDDVIVDLVWKVATELGCDPLSLPRIQDQIDAESLASVATNSYATVEFEYAGCSIFVASDGRVSVERLNEETVER